MVVPTTPDTALPTIDLSKIRNGTPNERVKESQRLLDAATGSGFMYVTGTGPTEEEVDKMFEIYKEFFDLPFGEKDKYRKPGPGSNFGGYAPLDGVLGKAKPFDFWKGAENPQGSTAYKEMLSMPNLAMKDWWATGPGAPPKILENWDFYNGFIASIQSMVIDMLKGLAISLQIPESEGGEDYFLKSHDFQGESQNFLRCLHYPPLPEEADDMEGVLKTKVFRLPGHTDTGSLTVLFQHEGGDGLQIRPLVPSSPPSSDAPKMVYSKDWIDVPPRKGCAVVNFADTLQWWTNGLIKSTFHRVAPKLGGKATNHRYSIGWFQYATQNTLLPPVPSPLIPRTNLHGIQHEGLENTGFVTAGEFYDWYNKNFIQWMDKTNAELVGQEGMQGKGGY